MMLSSQGQNAQGAFSSLFQPFSEENFQQSVVNPTMQTYKQQILPQMQQQFVDANASSSSALNQALAQSAGDVSNLLAGQRLSMQQNASQNQLGGLGALINLLSQKSFDPIVQGPQAGIGGDLLKAALSIGGGMMLSSRKVKENIREYNEGLEIVRDLNVMQYDYIPEVPVFAHKGRIGLIAEDVPQNIQGKIENVLAVDLYALVSILVNAVKQLDERLTKLQELDAKPTKLQERGV